MFSKIVPSKILGDPLDDPWITGWEKLFNTITIIEKLIHISWFCKFIDQEKSDIIIASVVDLPYQSSYWATYLNANEYL